VKRLAWLALWMFALCGTTAFAAQRSVSYSTWVVAGNTVTLRFLLPASEARRLTGVGVAVLTTDKLKDYMLQHVSVDAAGRSCPAIDQGYDLGRVDPLAVGPDLYGFELVYRCADPRQLRLHNSVLFGPVRDHVNFARIQTRGQIVQQLFTVGRQTLALPDAGAPRGAGILAYLQIGLTHILGSADRWCLLLGALLLVQRRGDVGGIALALAGGYLLSLLVSASGWVLPRADSAEAFMGLLIVLFGAAITLRDAQYRWAGILAGPVLLLLLAGVSLVMHAPWAAAAMLGGACLFAGFVLLSRQLAGPGQFWLLLVALFAFLDGFAMSAVLPPAQLSRQSQLQIGLGLDAGAMLIEAVIVTLPMLVLLVVRAQRIVTFRSLLDDLSAACLSGVGTFWLVSRLWA
jgi:hypothetical protein